MPPLASKVGAAIAVGLIGVTAASCGPARVASVKQARKSLVAHERSSAPTPRQTATAHKTVAARKTAAPARYPGVYLGLMAGEWYGPSIRPRVLYLGADWTINHLRWSQWGQRGATGRGFYGA